MTLAERSATIGVNRKGGKYLHWLLIVLTASYFVLTFCYGLLYCFDPSFFSVEGKVPSTSLVWVGFILFIPAFFLACWDLRNMGNIVRVFTGNEGWIIGMAVDVFFDMIDKMEDETESRKYVLLGFILIGLVITLISINFLSDGTGLTGGTIIAVAKVHNSYFFQKNKKISQVQWILLYLLSVTSLLCKLSEGSGTINAAAAAAQQASAPTTPTGNNSQQSSNENTPRVLNPQNSRKKKNTLAGHHQA